MKSKNELITPNTRLNVRGRLRQHYGHGINLKIIIDNQLSEIKKDIK